MKLPAKTQIVIIGAGPTGLSLAVQLLRYNIDFVILEKNEKTTHLSKAIVVQARTLEIFNESGLAKKAIEEGKLTTAMNMFHKGRKIVRVDIAGLGQGLSEFPFALSLEQSKTEKLLVDYLAEKGKTIQWKSEFTRFEETPTGIKSYFRNAAGEEALIESNYIVGCDGARSLVRKQLGQDFEGDTVAKLFYVTDVILESEVLIGNQLFIFLIRKGFILFFPMEGEGHWRIIGIIPDHKEEELVDIDIVKEEIIKQIVSPILFKEVKWFSTYKVHSRKADAFRKGRAFIAGDAGHIHTPAGGMGMNTGIQDAYNLAWKLAFTIRYGLNDDVLESYDKERVSNAARLLRTTDRMFEFMTGANRFSNFIRLKIFPLIAGYITRSRFFNKRIFPLISMTSISYPGSPLTIKSSVGKIKAGQRMPYFIFKDGKNIYEWLGEPGFKLLYFGDKQSSDTNELNEFPFPVYSYSFNEIPKNVFGSNRDFYILLRPDNHISYIGKEPGRCTEQFASNLV